MPARLNDHEYNRLMNNDKVIQAMTLRCEEEDHSWEGACSLLMEMYYVCKWCGERKRYVK